MSEVTTFRRTPDWLWPLVAGAAGKVWCALASYANDNWQCWPSEAGLAERADVSVATVKRGLRSLKKLRAVTVEYRPGERSTYTLHFHGPAPMENQPANQPATVAADSGVLRPKTASATPVKTDLPVGQKRPDRRSQLTYERDSKTRSKNEEDASSSIFEKSTHEAAKTDSRQQRPATPLADIVISGITSAIGPMCETGNSRAELEAQCRAQRFDPDACRRFVDWFAARAAEPRSKHEIEFFDKAKRIVAFLAKGSTLQDFRVILDVAKQKADAASTAAAKSRERHERDEARRMAELNEFRKSVTPEVLRAQREELHRKLAGGR